MIQPLTRGEGEWIEMQGDNPHTTLPEARHPKVRQVRPGRQPTGQESAYKTTISQPQQSGSRFQKGPCAHSSPQLVNLFFPYNENSYIPFTTPKLEVERMPDSLAPHAMLSFLCPKHVCFPPLPTPSPQVHPQPLTDDVSRGDPSH